MAALTVWRRIGDWQVTSRYLAVCASAFAVGVFLLFASPTIAAELKPEHSGPEVSPAFVVTRPSLVMVDPEIRRAELSVVGDLEAWCGTAVSGWPKHGITHNVESAVQPGQTLAWTMMRAGARVVAFDDKDALQAIRRNLKRWAKADALDRFEDPPSAKMYYNLNRTLLPVITAYSLLRDDPALSDVDRNEIEHWLGEVIWRRGPQREFKEDNISSRNNHRYLSASVNMAWGAFIGSDALFRDGVSAFKMAIDDMAEDGSLPLEMTRGDRALHYQRHAIASLVAIAEMAAVQSYDLYTYQAANGASLHLAVDFLGRALHDPRVLEQRFELNGLGKPPEQDLGFLVERGHERQYMAWLEPYRRRFGGGKGVQLLEEALAALGEPRRSFVDDYSGANTTCLFALPDPDDLWERSN